MPISERVISGRVAAGQCDYTVHAIFEAAQDLLFVDEIEASLLSCEIIEDDEARRRCLALGRLPDGGRVHAVIDYADWFGDPVCPLVVVTVYRPAPDAWIDGRVRKN